MGKDSDIEWTHHTFNPWWGCAKVSAACANCYAEAWAKRVGSDVWGVNSDRRFFSDKHWNDPKLWNEEARKTGVRFRVFCASMADVFESRTDLKQHRERLWELIAATECLDWLLLTKRPENIERMVPWNDQWPSNIWLGTTVENEAEAEARLPHLLSHSAAVRFLSCEPLLGPLNLNSWVNNPDFYPINWIIAGGESGPKSRPMNPEWVRNLRDFCKKQKIAFHFKQWGHWIPKDQLETTTKKKKTIAHIPVQMVAMGKKEAGRVLDGLTYDGLPFSVTA